MGADERQTVGESSGPTADAPGPVDRRRAFVAFHVRRREWAAALSLLDPRERHPSIVRWWLDGRIDVDTLRSVLCDWWADCDLTADGGWQDVNLAMFQAAAPVMDESLPPAERFRIYRAQSSGAPPGIAWTFDRAFALAEPHGTSPEPGRVLFEGEVDRADVLGYFRTDGRSDVIVDPACVRDLLRVTAWRPRA